MSGDCMRFPDTVEEFMDQYKVVDREGIYMSKGSELVPIFRMDQWFEHEKAQLSQEGTTTVAKSKRTFVELLVHYPHPDVCTYPEYKGKPYYSIKYIEDGECFVGFGTYKPEVLSQYLRDYFMTSAQPEERTKKRTETRACDLISRQAAIDAVALSAAEWDGMYVQDINGRIREALEKLPPAQPEITEEAVKEYCRKRCLCVVDGALLKKYASTQPELKWIPCSKQLPKQGQEVICQCRANIIKVLKLDAYGDWYQDADHCYMGGFVIAWMPLPEPYQEGETT